MSAHQNHRGLGRSTGGGGAELNGGTRSGGVGRPVRFTPTCVGTTAASFHGHENAARFTPTCVGTTASPLDVCEHDAVHPHVRGDNARQCPSEAVGDGSPPRAWGQLPGATHNERAERIRSVNPVHSDAGGFATRSAFQRSGRNWSSWLTGVSAIRVSTSFR